MFTFLSQSNLFSLQGQNFDPPYIYSDGTNPWTWVGIGAGVVFAVCVLGTCICRCICARRRKGTFITLKTFEEYLVES